MHVLKSPKSVTVLEAATAAVTLARKTHQSVMLKLGKVFLPINPQHLPSPATVEFRYRRAMHQV